MHPIEDPVPFSRSVLWRLQREFFERHGPQALGRSTAPIGPTAHALARAILGFLHDLKRGVPGAVDPARPIHVVEIGGGSGALAYGVSRALFGMLGRLPHLGGLRVRYVLTDGAAATVERWANEPRLKLLADEGRIDFAHHDAGADDDPILRRSGEALSAAAGGNPIVLIARRSFGFLPHDAFAVDDGQFSELRGALTLDEAPPRPIAEMTDVLEKCSLGMAPVPAQLPYYGVPSYDSVLLTCSTRLKRSVFLFPIAALRCIDRLTRIGGGRLLALIEDRASFALADLEGRDTLGLTRDRVFSTRLNAGLIRLAVERLGGAFVGPEAPRPGFDSFALLRGPNVNAWSETQDALATHLFPVGPATVADLSAALDRSTELDLDQRIAYLALGRHDWRLLAGMGEALIGQAGTAAPDQRAALLAAIDRAWEGYFPDGDKFDFPYLLGRLCRRLGHADKAIAYYGHSLQEFGEDPATHYNIGRCHLDQGDKQKAIRHFRRALELNPDDAEAKAKLASLEKS